MSDTPAPDAAAHADAHGSHGDAHGHVSPLSLYYWIYGWLLVFTVITVGVSFWFGDALGAWSIPVAMAVAIVKATLVCMYFMHLKWDAKFNVFVFVSAIIAMLIFFTFTMMDVATRGLVIPGETAVEEKARAADAFKHQKDLQEKLKIDRQKEHAHEGHGH
jgi:cytochrome c oxidase subunit 4